MTSSLSLRSDTTLLALVLEEVAEGDVWVCVAALSNKFSEHAGAKCRVSSDTDRACR